MTPDDPARVAPPEDVPFDEDRYNREYDNLEWFEVHEAYINSKRYERLMDTLLSGLTEEIYEDDWPSPDQARKAIKRFLESNLMEFNIEAAAKMVVDGIDDTCEEMAQARARQ